MHFILGPAIWLATMIQFTHANIDYHVLPLSFNPLFQPTVIELLSSVAIKFDLFKDHPLLQDIISPGHVSSSSSSSFIKAKTLQKGNVVNYPRANNVLGLLGTGLDISIAGLLRVKTTQTPTQQTLIDTEWGGATTSRTMDSQNDNAWFAELSFGTPKQTLTIDIDSGSADTVLYDDSCTTCQLVNHTAFNHTASSTFIPTNQSFSTVYGDGTNLTGMLSRDAVYLTDTLKVDHQLLALITKRQGGSDTHAWDGVMGIGPDALSFVEGNITPLSNLVRSGKLAQPLVGVLLIKENKMTGVKGGGEYRWGGINSAYIHGEVIYTPVTSSYFWGCDMSAITVNQKQMFTATDYGRAIFDTGTSLIYTSDSIAKNVHAQIPRSYLDKNEQVYYVPCQTTLSSSPSPNVFFEIQGISWGVPASDLAFRPSGRSDGFCISGLQGGSPLYTILGDVFIKNHYIVFNYGSAAETKLSIGIANRTDIQPML